MDIYREKILDHYNNPRNFGNLKNATSESILENISCGDVIKMQIKLKGSKITDIKFDGEGCAIAIASASILTEYVKGKQIKKVANLSIEQLMNLLGIQLTISRIKCANLSLETFKRCIQAKK